MSITDDDHPKKTDNVLLTAEESTIKMQTQSQSLSNKSLSLFTLMKQYNNIRQPKTKLQFYFPLQIEHGMESISDYDDLISNITLLKHKVVLPIQDIQPVLTALEFLLSTGNNGTQIIQMFFIRKLFPEVIHCLHIAYHDDYIERILMFIETLLPQRQIAKLLGNDLNFLRTILSFATKKKFYEIAIKIAENLLMNSSHLIPMRYIEDVIMKGYRFSLESQNVNSFCRLLAILLFDYKKMEFLQVFRSKEHFKIKSPIKVIAENQSICLNLEGFIRNVMCSLNGGLEKTKEIAHASLLDRSVISLLFEPYDRESINVQRMLKENEDYETRKKKEIGEGCFIKYEEFMNVIQLNIFQRMTWEDHSKKETARNNISRAISSEVTINIPATTQTIPYDTKVLNDGKTKVVYVRKFIPSSSNSKPNTKSNPSINIHNIYNKITKDLALLHSKTKINDDRRKFTSLMKLHSYQIEMLFVLSNLLGSKRKIEIQDSMKEMNIINILSSYIDYMEWGNIFSETQRPIFTDDQINFEDDSAYHGKGCCCDIDNALKIQYLRLLYTYCCRDISNIHNKIDLLSPYDITVFMNKGYGELLIYALDDYYKIYNGKPKTSFNKAFENIYTSLKLKTIEEKRRSVKEILLDMTSVKAFKENVIDYNYNQYDEKIGLLQKIIYKYMLECYYSSAKFWLASCIEVVLRGNNTFMQTYIISTGLVPCILYDIIYTKTEQNQILQFSFDILGELIKFNKASFLLLNHYLSDKAEFGLFFDKAFNEDTLIDSNVFLRSIILSKYYFDKNDKDIGLKEGDWFSKQCNLCQSIDASMHKIFLSMSIIVKPQDINQTNISCINSALLILIIAYLKGNLKEFIREIHEMYPEKSKEAIVNFRPLLILWKDFYNYRPKDSASLQHSTTISFDIWQKVNSLLLTEVL